MSGVGLSPVKTGPGRETLTSKVTPSADRSKRRRTGDEEWELKGHLTLHTLSLIAPAGVLHRDSVSSKNWTLVSGKVP